MEMRESALVRERRDVRERERERIRERDSVGGERERERKRGNYILGLMFSASRYILPYFSSSILFILP